MRILITGSSGQDGSLLAEKYRINGHQVLGISNKNVLNQNGINQVNVDLSDPFIFNELMNVYNPNVIFHLAAVHFPSTIKDDPSQFIKDLMVACHINVTKNILEWQVKNTDCRSVFALSSQMYTPKKSGEVIDEKSKLDPQNYYAETKSQAFIMLKNYRLKYGIHASGAILFNHTSSKSKPHFLFPQLARKIQFVLSGSASEIRLQNPGYCVDISHAEEICAGMSMMAKQSQPQDFVLSSGRLVTIRDVLEKTLNLLKFEGRYKIINESRDTTQFNKLMGNPAKALALLGWKVVKSPEDILFELVNEVGY